jgi:alpha-ketoglutarate-dependent taurine dioxygenase
MFDAHTTQTDAFALITTPARRPITDVTRERLLEPLAERGAVLFRGFDVTLESFSALVEQVSKRTAIDPAREFFARHIQLVDAGTAAVGLHCENGNTPILPDVVWFYCAKAARRGSQTTLCDGQVVWDRLSTPVRELFERHRVTFARTVPEELWVRYVRHERPDLPADVVITQELVQRMFANMTGTEMIVQDDRSLHVKVTLPMVHSTRFDTRLSFANSLLGPSYNYQTPTIKLDNGEPIPASALTEIEEVTDRCTHDIPWQDGDVIAIDNTRVMHGRREIVDDQRKLFTALSFV